MSPSLGTPHPRAARPAPLASAMRIAALGGVFLCAALPSETRSAPPALRPRSAILIGWDGVRRETLQRLLERGVLPNLRSLIARGVFVDIAVTSGNTDTKAGWSQILTGYDPRKTGVFGNLYYKPIPRGYTIHERLEKFYGDAGITTVLLAGKGHNLGARGPHRICLNCTKSTWFDGDASVSRVSGQAKILREREGEPYFLSRSGMDVFENGLREADSVGARAVELLEQNKDRRFFFFVQFREPDQTGGHEHGDGSAEYSREIILVDRWLGRIMAKLDALGLRGRTLVLVTSDHGFDPGARSHWEAPRVFLAAGDAGLAERRGDRKDIAPTVLDWFGLDLGGIRPRLDGRSLGGSGWRPTDGAH